MFVQINPALMIQTFTETFKNLMLILFLKFLKT